eukprot:515347-Pelagomonas_calceolata.AAC.3
MSVKYTFGRHDTSQARNSKAYDHTTLTVTPCMGTGLPADLPCRYGFSAFRSGYYIADRPELNKAVFERLRAGSSYAQVSRREVVVV